MGNLCFGKCNVLHCSLWAVQTINFHIHATRNIQTQLKSTVHTFTLHHNVGLETDGLKVKPVVLQITHVSQVVLDGGKHAPPLVRKEAVALRSGRSV